MWIPGLDVEGILSSLHFFQFKFMPPKSALTSFDIFKGCNANSQLYINHDLEGSFDYKPPFLLST